MKYQDILADVLAGEWVRYSAESKWFKMMGHGQFVHEDWKPAEITIKRYKLDTWETKPEEIYIWGWVKPENDEEWSSYIGWDQSFSKNTSGYCINEKPLFPAGRPKKYKLIPVEAEYNPDGPTRKIKKCAGIEDRSHELQINDGMDDEEYSGKILDNTKYAALLGICYEFCGDYEIQFPQQDITHDEYKKYYDRIKEALKNLKPLEE